MHPFSLNDEALDRVAGGTVIAVEPGDTGPIEPPITSVITSEEGGAAASKIYGEAGGLPPGEGTTLRIGEEGGGGDYAV